MVSQQKVESMLGNLERYRAILVEIIALPKQDLLLDVARMGGAKYYLQTAIESCIDIAHHIIASKGWRKPKNYADAFVVLSEQRIIPGDMAPVLAQMARFRNRLVHLYWQVDDIAVYNILHRDLGDFDRFTSHIRKFISQEEEDSEP